MSSDCFGASRTGCDPADLFERFELCHRKGESRWLSSLMRKRFTATSPASFDEVWRTKTLRTDLPGPGWCYGSTTPIRMR